MRTSLPYTTQSRRYTDFLEVAAYMSAKGANADV